MKYIHHVPLSVSDTASLCILGRQNETNELFTVDPADPIQDRQCGQHPKRVANLSGHHVNQNHQEREGALAAVLTSGNFSGRPLSPPFGS